MISPTVAGSRSPPTRTVLAGNYAFINITGSSQAYNVQLAITKVNVSADYVNEYNPGGISQSWLSVPGYAAPGYTTSATTTVPTTTSTITPTPTPTPNPPWYCGWAYRKNITIINTQVVGSLTNFPVLISLPSDSDLQAHAQGNGNDILFTDSSGTAKLNHEIESYTSSTGALIAWVNVPSLSSSANTTIYMYYGNPSAPSQQNPSGVWDTGYRAVWHLEEVGVGGAGEFRDSTSNGNNGQGGNGGGTNPPTRANGKIGYGQSFASANNQFIQVPDSASLQITGPLTIEAWINGNSWADSGGGNKSIVGRQFGTKTQDAYKMAVWPNAGASSTPYGFLTSGSVSGNTVTKGNWYDIALAMNSSAYLYRNGAYVANAASSISIDSNKVVIGGEETGGGTTVNQLFDGTIDEVRISNVARSDNWIATEYNNENSPGSFSHLNASEPYSC